VVLDSEDADGNDPQASVSWRRVVAELATDAAVLLALRQMGLRWGAALPAEETPFDPAAPGALFVVWDRARVACVLPARRTVVLTAAEHESAESALVVWSAGWRGGTFRLDWRDGRWQATPLGEWIT